MQNDPSHEPLTTPLAIVQELARRFQAGELESAFALYHPQLRIEQPASLPHGGVFHGHAGVRAMGALFAELWERTITNPRRMACGQGVVQITTQTWKAKATGRSATLDVVELFAFSEGMVSEIRVFQQDTQRFLATLQPNDGAARAHGDRTTPWERTAALHVVERSRVAELCRHWEDGWNAEDVACIVAPFDADVVFSSPFVSSSAFVARSADDPARATISGLEAVRKYVADSLQRATPGIRYTLEAAYAGADAVVLAYTVHHPTRGDRRGVDSMRLGPDGKVREWRCHYLFE